MKLERKNVFWFWGGMDLFYLLQFIVWNVYHQRVPFYSDILAIYSLCKATVPRQPGYIRLMPY